MMIEAGTAKGRDQGVSITYIDKHINHDIFRVCYYYFQGNPGQK